MRMRELWGAALGALAVVAAVSCAAAQEKYPSRPIQVIVPTPPGGGTDIIARQLAEIIEPILGQKLVIENKPGGGGSVGTALITQARPDGYTLLMNFQRPADDAAALAAGAVHG